MRIIILGVGNVGLNLLDSFIGSDVVVEQIVGRDEGFLYSISQKYDVKYTTDLNNLSVNADLYIVSVNDESIKDIVLAIPKNKLVVHTSGSTDIDGLKMFKRHGVFYPLQTFSKEKLIDFGNIPICIEGSDSNTIKLLTELAGKITSAIYYLNSEQRKYVHLAAVYACNFTNHMYAIAERILTEKCIPKEILSPLVIETAKKFTNISAMQAQTGPAKRNDQNIIKKQLDLLSSNPELMEIYQLISRNIQDYNNEEF